MQHSDPSGVSAATPDRPGVAVLGPVEVLPDTVPVAPSGHRTGVLLAVLALAAPRPVPVATLVDTLWGEDLPAVPRAALQSLVSRLRAVAPGTVRSGPGGYGLDVPTDLDLARDAAARARTLLTSAGGASGTDPGAGRAAGHDTEPGTEPGTEAAAVLDRALALWRAAPGEDLAGHSPGVAAELADAARRVRTELLTLRRTAARRTADHDTLAALARAALEADPLDEDAARDLMTALVATGRPDEAVRVYAGLRHQLVAELGTDPAPDITALHDGLLSPAGPARRGLPAEATPLLGREEDVAAVSGLLRTHRLVTVLGPGGLGKTRLAREVARAERHVVMVELAGVRTDDDVVLAVADGLGVSAGSATTRLADRLLAGDLHEQIAARVRGASLLVVLDNCEHVADGAARWAGELLAAGPGVRLLATSRSPLQLTAEQVYPLAPLVSRHGGGTGPAVELFRQRARAARPGASLADDVVARLCDRLDGLPLAIELAAARVRTLSVEEIERHLDARFALLRGGDRSAPDRHRTLEAVIDWSWNLLTDGQRALWRRVAVLPDGVPARAVAVLGRAGTDTGGAPNGGEHLFDVLDDVDGLVAQSLLTVTEPDGDVRYRMLETVREFGLLRLSEAGEEETVREALWAWALGVAARCEADFLGPGQPGVVAELARESDNLLFALREAARPGAAGPARPDVVVRLFVMLGGVWMVSDAGERILGLVPLLNDAVTGWQVPEEQAGTTALALLLAVGAAQFPGGGNAARPLARLRRLLRDHPGIGERTRVIAEHALSTPQEALAGLAGLGDHPDPLIGFLACMGVAQEAENAGRIQLALERSLRAYERGRDVGDVATRAAGAMYVASCAAEQGDLVTAAQWSATARALLDELGAHAMQRQLDGIDLAVALEEGDLRRAEEVCARLEAARDDEAGGRDVLAAAESYRAEISLARGDVSVAFTWYERAIAAISAGDGPGPHTPWVIILGSAYLVRLAEHGRTGGSQDSGTAVGGEARAAEVLSRVIDAVGIYRRWNTRPMDHPVVGTACLGVGVHRALGSDATAAAGGAALELVALGEVMGARQDMVALRHERLFALLTRRYGDDAVSAARAAASRMPREDLPARALTLLEVPADEDQALRM
ncbi:ATP-binding protein [Myceligenerans indicum]|uniref:Bacterial transcriptional activator domain-containing protein n=1 Tax=Myceligenerans indicum TaxID=2593663 RepID=A0ABS1LIB2_9MICO|nr:BTAD domain-containing putative transcriptional regulator [Myceligenerans indicum]MBL0885970.1 hypothetical protein [Myceligenerans indicum]